MSTDHLLHIIHEQYAQPGCALKQIAKTANLSSRYLGRLFQQRTGESFRHYLRDIRIQRAAELLSSEEVYAIKSVAAMVGYSSRRHFDEDFRARLHCTPAEFKKRTQLI